MVKRLVIRFCMLAVMGAIYLFTNTYFNKLEKEYIKPVTFTFKLPLPEEIISRHRLSPPINVEKVIIAGSFSGWHSGDDNFRMKRTSPLSWVKTLDLNPGRYPYKFVVYVKHEGKTLRIWSRDRKAVLSENDAFGGRNSVHIVKTTRNTRFVLNFILIVCGIGLIVYTLFEYVIRILMRFRLSLKYKILILFLFFITSAGLFFIFYQQRSQRSLIRTIQAEKINILHNLLMSRGVDFSDLYGKKSLNAVRQGFADFFRSAMVRYRLGEFSNRKLHITRLFLLDKNGELVHYAMEFTRERSMLRRMGKSGNRITAYYRKKLKQLFVQYKQNAARKEIRYIYFDDAPPLHALSGRDRERRDNYEKKAAWFRYDNFFYPIYVGLELKGYYFVNFHPEAFSVYIRNTFSISLLLALLLILIFTVLIIQLGRIILHPFRILAEGLDLVKQGDLDFRTKINTRDEIEELSNSYNYMTEELKISRDKIKDYAHNLEKKVRERTATLLKRTEELKTSEARFRNMTDLLPAAVVELDPRFRFTFINRAGRIMFGLEDGQDDLTGSDGAGPRLMDYIHERDRSRVAAQMDDVLHGKTTALFQYRIVCGEGKEHLALVNAAPILEGKHINGIRMTLSDIEPFLESALLPEDDFFDGYGLSKREKEIVFYIMQGYSYQGMADKLFVAKSTVKTHIQHVYMKMDISSRKELLQIIRKEREEKFGAASFILTIWNSITGNRE